MVYGQFDMPWHAKKRLQSQMASIMRHIGDYNGIVNSGVWSLYVPSTHTSLDLRTQDLHSGGVQNGRGDYGTAVIPNQNSL